MVNYGFYQEYLLVTTPMLLWVTEPHLYLGVETDGFTRTLSPSLICSASAEGADIDVVIPIGG